VTDTATYSTLFLTLLMLIGLFFFIRASTKDRTETVTLNRPQDSATAFQELIQYFESRAYGIENQVYETTQASLTGIVRPSLFLAIFLTILAAIGFICLAIVLTILLPSLGITGFGLTILAPAAGLYYWQRARRQERVTLQVQPADSLADDVQSQATVTAHRDELIALRQALKTQDSHP
jgi:Flp pilus assembly protein TadB